MTVGRVTEQTLQTLASTRMQSVVAEEIHVDERYNETQTLQPDDHRPRLEEAPFPRAGTAGDAQVASGATSAAAGVHGAAALYK